MATKATELRLIQIFRENGITGWRRGCALRIGDGVRGLASRARSLSAQYRDPKSQTPATRATRSSGRVKPDFVFQKLKVVLFVDGCFWHGCPRHATWHKTRAAFWKAKIEGNRDRDRRVNRALRERGWIVLRVWQHELRRKDEARLLRRLQVVCGTKPGRAKIVAPKGAAPKR